METVVEAIYEASADPSRWPAALAKVGDRFGGASIIVGLQRLPDPVFHTSTARLDDSLLPLFLERYATLDTNPFLRHFFETPVGTPFDSMEKVAPLDFRRTDFYADIYAPQKIWQRASATLLCDRNLFAPLGMLAPDGCETLSHSEAEELAYLSGHLGRALKVTARLKAVEAERDGLLAALDRLRNGVFLLDEDGRLLRMNRAAERMVVAQDGLRLEGGGLVAMTNGDRSRLARLLARACRERAGGTLAVQRPSGAPAYGLEAVPLHVAALEPRPAAVVFVSDPAAVRPPDAARLAALYGLTAAEARLAQMVGRGLSLAEAADRLRLSRNTLKTLLQRVFAKMQARRQSELVHRLAIDLPDIETD